MQDRHNLYDNPRGCDTWRQGWFRNSRIGSISVAKGLATQREEIS